MGAGRFVCVALPFGLTLGSLICILIVMLAGITNKDLDMFQVKTQNLSISSSSLENLADLITKRDANPASISALTVAGLSPNPTTDAESAVESAVSGNNITATDLGLADSYKVSMWNYCAETGSKSNCTKAKFNWAATALNTTNIASLATSTSGLNVTLPAEMRSALHTYTIVAKWTEVVYIIAVIACSFEMLLALFAFCSRAGSCITFLISGISTVTIVIASIMATVSSSVVTGSLNSVTKAYGVKCTLNTSFLATTWLAVAFSVASGFFWTFTICCCASDHSSRKKRGADDNEKLIPTGAYQRVGETTQYNSGSAGQQQGIYNPQQYGAPAHNKPTRGAGAYEPYAHTAI